MVERQLRARGISDERVLRAMEEVPRERFVDAAERPRAYRDGALAIGAGQTISQPWIVASMTSLLGLDGHERVLEVGTGSGYAAAVLSRCCRDVVTIERHEGLAQRARSALGELGYANVEVRTGDGTLGARDRAPFDGISVTATATGNVPTALTEQVAPGGTIVCPIRDARGEHLVTIRDGEERLVAPVRFVPLVDPVEDQTDDAAE